MSNLLIWFQRLGAGATIGGAIIFSVNSATAQVIQDATLPINSQVTTQEKILNIKGGTRSGNNLFHSFEQFSVPYGITAYFKNTGDIQNIISRVTGKSISNIEGILKADGIANLFLINPNGIIFGSHASLDIGGSFIASTATSVNFADGTKFSTTVPQATTLLTMSIPVGLQFGATANPIRNQSQASPGGATTVFGEPVGLQVKPHNTLMLLGGDVVLEGGNLTVESGNIELGSVASNSLVTLNSTNQGWVLGYEGVQNYQNIKLIQRVANGSEVGSIVDGSSQNNGSSVQVRGNSVELIGRLVRLRSQTKGIGNGGDLNITARKLIIQDGAQVGTSTTGKGTGGSVIVDADESVQLIGSATLRNTISALLSTTFGDGNAGNLTINTAKLSIQNGAEISSGSTGNFLNSSPPLLFQPATGEGGNLNITASESVELIGTSPTGSPSSLLARTLGSGEAGKVTITTGKLTVRDGAAINVSSQLPLPIFIYLGDASNLGKAGELNVTANSIQLDNKGKLTSNSESGQGGNITLQVRDLLLMRRDSQISTNSGKSGTGGNGGNIKIDAPNGLIFAVPLNNSDITANAFFGSGGQITINADSLFGFVQRDRANLANILSTNKPEELNPNRVPTNDITAFSQENPSLSGSVEINSPDIDPSQGLVELPQNVVDASRQIAAGCNAGKTARASFTTIGRGGIESSPTDALMSDAVLADWISPETLDENRVSKSPTTQAMLPKVKSTNASTPIVEAQGWVLDSNGNVVLVAQAPTTIPHSPALNPASCAVR
ncbi:filamentous hemagglutinin N-terminal domain-containing protein [Nostocaceae cyanobacterium CENA369]|uniref:Filamentous hemagglutinin N-terminal domain-containing protein n=1 Tax=Dendronalium phyllosphericum CENA369 TaxID=1725256 RepID=A0A8J7I4I1_9NOST|nr:filamentous hemagglutinin N-terminal domain-containing protein [Dendronalium phyllosphericum]MBH8572811.1 filamentous hemagglutinin N-terminal domain-containing protein [Dendronalium phyllosphericum CENA369]